MMAACCVVLFCTACCRLLFQTCPGLYIRTARTLGSCVAFGAPQGEHLLPSPFSPRSGSVKKADSGSDITFVCPLSLSISPFSLCEQCVDSMTLVVFETFYCLPFMLYLMCGVAHDCTRTFYTGVLMRALPHRTIAVYTFLLPPVLPFDYLHVNVPFTLSTGIVLLSLQTTFRRISCRACRRFLRYCCAGYPLVSSSSVVMAWRNARRHCSTIYLPTTLPAPTVTGAALTRDSHRYRRTDVADDCPDVVAWHCTVRRYRCHSATPCRRA